MEVEQHREEAMSTAQYICERFTEELDRLIGQVRGRTDGVNIADVLLHTPVRELKFCAGHVDDFRSEGIREMIEAARDEVVMATYPLPVSDPPAFSGPRRRSRSAITFGKKMLRRMLGFWLPGCMRDAVGQNIRDSRRIAALDLRAYFAVPLLPYKRQILYPSADPWHIGSTGDGALNGPVIPAEGRCPMAVHLLTAPIATRSSADTAPVRRRLARIDGRSKAGRRVKALVRAYSERLNNSADALIQADVARLAECETLCEQLRAQALRGEPTDLLGLNRLEGTSRRLRAALGLNAPPQPELPTLDQMLREIDE